MARAHNSPAPALSPLCKQIQTDCCATLLGTSEKAAIIRKISALERAEAINLGVIKTLREQRTMLGAKIDTLEAEIVALHSETIGLVRDTFNATYVGKPADRMRAWVAVCNELGMKA